MCVCVHVYLFLTHMICLSFLPMSVRIPNPPEGVLAPNIEWGFEKI